MDIKSRLKNYGLWVAVIAFIPMLLQSFGLNILPGNYEQVANAFLGIVVLLGLVNNPTTDNKGFADDKVNTITVAPVEEVKSLENAITTSTTQETTEQK